MAAAIVARRFGREKEGGRSVVDVLDFYPGFVDAESVLASVQRGLKRAQLEGLPYSAVVVDGVHNLLMQFPLLEREPLLWPTMYRLFRTEGLETVTTFSFFEIARLAQLGESDGGLPATASIPNDAEAALGQSEALFFHVLVSSCDYNFLMERPRSGHERVKKSWVRVKLAGSVDGFGEEPEEFWWDPPEFRYRAAYAGQ